MVAHVIRQECGSRNESLLQYTDIKVGSSRSMKKFAPIDKHEVGSSGSMKVYSIKQACKFALCYDSQIDRQKSFFPVDRHKSSLHWTDKKVGSSRQA